MRKILLSTTAIGGLAAMLVLGAAPVSAHSIHHHIVDPTSISVGDFNGQTLSFSTFDTNLGHLQSVLVVEDLTAHYGGSITATSTTTSATAHASTSLNINGGPAALAGNPALTLGVDESYNLLNNPTNELFPNVSQSFAPGDQSTGGTTTYGAAADWESVGPGTTTITLDSTTTADTPHNPFGILFNPTVDLTFNLDITYSYTTAGVGGGPVPEPASALLLGAGVLALGKLRKRRKR